MQSGQTQKHKRLYQFEAFDINGNLKWRDEFHNLTTNEGLDFINDTVFRGSSYTAALAVGLTDSTPSFAAGDTMASHAGWTEITDYTGSRPALTMAVSSGGAATNSASKATFVFTANVTIGGAFVVSGSTLIGGGTLNGGDRAMLNGETLLITVTNTIS